LEAEEAKKANDELKKNIENENDKKTLDLMSIHNKAIENI